MLRVPNLAGAPLISVELAELPPISHRSPPRSQVRTLERCVLLVLRRGIIADELSALPNMARIAWREQRLAHEANYATLVANWKHHAVRRLHVRAL